MMMMMKNKGGGGAAPPLDRPQGVMNLVMSEYIFSN